MAVSCPGSPCCSHQTSLFFSSLCAQRLLRMSSGRLISGSPSEFWGGGVICARRFVENLLQVCLELGFYLLPGKAAEVEFLLGITFLLVFGFKLQSELATSAAVVSVALCTRHHSCM